MEERRRSIVYDVIAEDRALIAVRVVFSITLIESVGDLAGKFFWRGNGTAFQIDLGKEVMEDNVVIEILVAPGKDISLPVDLEEVLELVTERRRR